MAKARPIGVFAIDKKANSVFTVSKRNRASEIALVDSPEQAQVIVAGRLKHYNRDNIVPGKIHVLWTNEPGEYQTSTIIRHFYPDVLGDDPLYVFNAHNGSVYTDNFYFGPSGRLMPVATGEADLNVPYADKMVTFAATYRPREGGVLKRVTLIQKRQRIALDLHAIGRARIIGRQWPEGIIESESRNDDRHRTKEAFVGQSNFNLCYENTLADHYVTEKLWEAIGAGALPIYHSNDTIYQTFARDSFIDGRDFATTQDLIDFIDAMPLEEYLRRLNACRAAYNHAVQLDGGTKARRRARDRLFNFLREITRPGNAPAPEQPDEQPDERPDEQPDEQTDDLTPVPPAAADGE